MSWGRRAVALLLYLLALTGLITLSGLIWTSCPAHAETRGVGMGFPVQRGSR